MVCANTSAVSRHPVGVLPRRLPLPVNTDCTSEEHQRDQQLCLGQATHHTCSGPCTGPPLPTKLAFLPCAKHQNPSRGIFSTHESQASAAGGKSALLPSRKCKSKAPLRHPQVKAKESSSTQAGCPTLAPASTPVRRSAPFRMALTIPQASAFRLVLARATASCLTCYKMRAKEANRSPRSPGVTRQGRAGQGWTTTPPHPPQCPPPSSEHHSRTRS